MLSNFIILILFSYMTRVFHNVSKGTSYELLTFLIAAPVLLSIILFMAIFIVGREQVIKELEEVLTGSKN